MLLRVAIESQKCVEFVGEIAGGACVEVVISANNMGFARGVQFGCLSKTVECRPEWASDPKFFEHIFSIITNKYVTTFIRIVQCPMCDLVRKSYIERQSHF